MRYVYSPFDKSNVFHTNNFEKWIPTPTPPSLIVYCRVENVNSPRSHLSILPLKTLKCNPQHGTLLGSVYFLEWECRVWIPSTSVFTYLKRGGSGSGNPWVPPNFGVGSGIPTPMEGGGSGNPLPSLPILSL